MSRQRTDPNRLGQRIAIVSMIVSAILATAKITIGLKANSTSVVSDGIESAGDVMTSAMVLIGLIIAARPADHDHPYGHGRFEILTALGVGAMLGAAGSLICFHSIQRAFDVTHVPSAFAVWPLLGSIVMKSGMWSAKRLYGRRIGSSSLLADANNDAVDILSGATALVALSLTLLNPARFAAADHVGGVAVGVIVILMGLRVIRDTTLQLMDTMPDDGALDEIRQAAMMVPGALGVEKCYARKTGLQYHVDLHLEVDPNLSVRDSHDIASRVRMQVRERLDWVADVLVHVEPHKLDTIANSNGK